MLQVEGLTYRYPDGTPVLYDISFRLRHGENVALIGANGAGKSTLLLHLNGMLRSPTGRITVADHLLTDANLGMIRTLVVFARDHP